MSTRFATWACGAALLVAGAGCTPAPSPDAKNSPDQKPTSQPSEGGEKGAGKKLKIAFVTNNASDYWTIARAGVEKAGKELPNVEISFVMPGDGTAAEQQRKVADLLATGVDGMAISPVDPNNQTEMLNNAAKQTLLITQDSDAPKSERACYVGTDNVAAGRQAGEELKKALPTGGKVMLFVGLADAQNAKERITGLKDAIKGTKIDILDIRTDETDRVRAKSNVVDAMVKVPDIAGLVGIWSYNGPAIVNAVKEANKAGKIKIVCFDEEDETLAGVKSGAIFSTIVQQPYEFGYRSVKLINDVKGGNASAIPADKRIIVPTKVITKDTVDEFAANLKKLRGK